MEPAKYFNNVILGQFTLTGTPVKVFVNGSYLTITDVDDIEDPIFGFGMDENGAMVPFDYRTVDHILVSDNNITLDTYNKAMSGESSEEAPAEEETEEETPKKEESVMKLKPMIDSRSLSSQRKDCNFTLRVRKI